MFYNDAWANAPADEDDDWETEADFENTETITEGSKGELIEGATDAATAARRLKELNTGKTSNPEFAAPKKAAATPSPYGGAATHSWQQKQQAAPAPKPAPVQSTPSWQQKSQAASAPKPTPAPAPAPAARVAAPPPAVRAAAPPPAAPRVAAPPPAPRVAAPAPVAQEDDGWGDEGEAEAAAEAWGEGEGEAEAWEGEAEGYYEGEGEAYYEGEGEAEAWNEGEAEAWNEGEAEAEGYYEAEGEGWAEGGGEVVVAAYDYVGQSEGDLSFYAGESITVVSKADDGWWTGTLNGVTGTFPANHIENYE